MVIALILPLEAQRRFARLDPNTPHYVSILHRLELYPFALHVWKTHPIMGIGLRPSTHENYLPDYHLHNQQLHEFPRAVATLQTFDNMLLTGSGRIWHVYDAHFTSGWSYAILAKILSTDCDPLRNPPPLDWYRVLVLLGFAIHSLSYDSLLFPPVNWLFHVQVGIMAGYHASETAPG